MSRACGTYGEKIMRIEFWWVNKNEGDNMEDLGV
jgi:hypothetical protein